MTGSAKRNERDLKIVHAAARLFAHQGYRGTSTREIARLAGITENTLFRHFESKENLFWIALRSSLAGWDLRPELLHDVLANVSPEVVLPRFLTQVVDTSILNPELLRLIAVAFLEMRWKAMEVCDEILSPVLAAINRYLAASIENGNLRRDLDPPLITAAMATMVLIHPMLMKFIDTPAAPVADSQYTIQVLSKFWVDVLVVRKRAGQ